MVTLVIQVLATINQLLNLIQRLLMLDDHFGNFNLLLKREQLQLFHFILNVQIFEYFQRIHPQFFVILLEGQLTKDDPVIDILRFGEQQTADEQNLLHGVQILFESLETVIPQVNELILPLGNLVTIVEVSLLRLLGFHKLFELKYLLNLADLLQYQHSLHALLIGKVKHLPYFIVYIGPNVHNQLFSFLVLLLIDV